MSLLPEGSNSNWRDRHTYQHAPFGGCRWCGEPSDQWRHRPRIVCLIGSTRFYETFRVANYRESLKGHIVLSIGFFPSDDVPHWQNHGITPAQKAMLDQLHLHKVELADEVLVLNVGGYIGESTAGELAHARAIGKDISWWEPHTAPEQAHAVRG